MNPPTEQLIRDYLNRVSVAARAQLGFAARQSLLDRTRARIEADCGDMNGSSAVRVRKALAGLGDPIALVELELAEIGSKAILAGNQHDPGVTGNGHGMAVSPQPAAELVMGNEIGKDLVAADGPNGSEPAQVASAAGPIRAGFTSAARRQRKTDPQSGSAGVVSAASASGQSGESASVPAQRGSDDASGRPLRAVPSVDPGRVGPSGAGRGAQPARTSGDGPAAQPSGSPPRRGRTRGSRRKPTEPLANVSLAAPDPSSASGSGAGGASTETRPQTSRFGRSMPADVGTASGFLRGVFSLARDNPIEVLALLLLGVGGVVYPPVWLLGAVLALPSKKWDLNDKFVGITLPVLLVIVGTVLILVFGGQHDTMTSYAYEAWLGAGRLSRGLALAGAIYLLWGLQRGRRGPKPPPWNVPHRLG